MPSNLSLSQPISLYSSSSVPGAGLSMRTKQNDQIGVSVEGIRLGDVLWLLDLTIRVCDKSASLTSPIAILEATQYPLPFEVPLSNDRNLRWQAAGTMLIDPTYGPLQIIMTFRDRFSERPGDWRNLGILKVLADMTDMTASVGTRSPLRRKRG